MPSATGGVGTTMARADFRKPKDPEFLSTLERGLSVLKVFSADCGDMALSDVAVAAGLSPAVARRCLNTLVELGYVAKYGRRFLLRPKVLELGDAYLSSSNIEQAITPYLQNLRDETGDSASMAVRSSNEVMYIAHVSTARPIRLSAHPGTRFPLHATSLGKVLLAFGDQPDLEQYLQSSVRQSFTTNTITSAPALKKALAQVRRAGFAWAVDELDYGICSIAVPIINGEGQVLAAINCSTTTSRVNKAEFETSRLRFLRESAAQIERSVQRFPNLVRSLTTKV